jgi:glyoxylase-like metal-dependent hydrolase (beta-lactamase superfamily II)
MIEAPLEYPFDTPPEPGTAIEIQPGVLWVRMPLPMALDHINLYLLEDSHGWWIVDTGIRGRRTQEAWERLFEGAMGGRPVVGIVCTHMHPDHVGQAGWLSERWQAPLYMTPLEYMAARVLTAEYADGPTWEGVRLYRRLGMPEAFVERAGNRKPGFHTLVEPLPRSYRRVSEGDVLEIGGSAWRAVVGRGHSPEHLCLHCAARGLLISGDQVIPRITSNVSVMPMEPEANPLSLWLDSCRRFMELPGGSLVLPAHNTPFFGLHARLEELIAHHEDHLAALEEACVEPQPVLDLLPVLFRRELDDGQLGLAVGECLAHLHLLMARGRVARELDANGLYRFRSLGEAGRQPSGPHELDEPPIMEWDGDPI